MNFSENLKHWKISKILHQLFKNMKIRNAQTFFPNGQDDPEVAAQWSNWQT